MKKQTEHFSIYSLSMANYLIRKGHDVVGVKDNEKDCKLKVFLFDNTIKLKEDMNEYRKRKV